MTLMFLLYLIVPLVFAVIYAYVSNAGSLPFNFLWCAGFATVLLFVESFFPEKISYRIGVVRLFVVISISNLIKFIIFAIKDGSFFDTLGLNLQIFAIVWLGTFLLSYILYSCFRWGFHRICR